MFGETEQTAQEARTTAWCTSAARLCRSPVHGNTEAECGDVCWSASVSSVAAAGLQHLRLADVPPPVLTALPARWRPGIPASKNIPSRQSETFSRVRCRAQSASRSRREIEQIKNKKRLADKCKWEQISSHYSTCRSGLAAEARVRQRDYLGWPQSSWYNGWQQLSTFRSKTHIHHGGWQPSTASWAGNCKKLPRPTSKCIYILLPLECEAAQEVGACY